MPQSAYSDIYFSQLIFALKGKTQAQIISSLAEAVADFNNLSEQNVKETLDHLKEDLIVGIGNGVAIFDWRSPEIASPYIGCVTLETPVVLPAVDDRPVDIILTHISPSQNGVVYLRELSRLTRRFMDRSFLDRIRDVKSQDGLESVLTPDNLRLMAA